MTIFDEMKQELDGAVSFEISEAGRTRAFKLAMEWVATHGHRSDPRFLTHVESFRERVWGLVNHTQISGVLTLVPKRQEDRDTLTLLVRGSLWFAGDPDMEKKLAAELVR